MSSAIFHFSLNLPIINLKAKPVDSSNLKFLRKVSITNKIYNIGLPFGVEVESPQAELSQPPLMHALNQGSLRFKGLVKEAKAAEVLQVIMETAY
nr:U-box domain-containing protein 38-like [Ipomoea trifida]